MEHSPGTMARPRELLLVSAAGLILALVMTWPLVTGLGHLGRTLGTDADGQFSIWNIAWVARTLLIDPLHLFDANIFFPHKTTLAYSEANLLPGVAGVPVYWLSRNPWLTLNVVLLLAFASAFVGAYLLLQYLSGDRRAALPAAIMYAFCPYTMSHLSHIQLLMTGGIPLSLLLLHRIADAAVDRDTHPTTSTTGRIGSSPRSQFFRRGAALGVAMAAQALSCAYYGIFTGLAVGFVSLMLAWRRRLWRCVEYWTAIGAGVGISIALVLPFFVPYVRVQEESGFRRTIEDAIMNSAQPSAYLASAARAHAWLLDIARSIGRFHEVLFPGMLAIALGLAGLLLAMRRAAPASRERETALVYTILTLTAFWASFGPAAGLYRVLFYLPAFSFLRAPSRFGLVVVLGLAVLASLALRRLFEAIRPARRTLAAGLMCAAVVADVTVIPIRWYAAPDLPSPYALLAERPRGPVAEFPFYGERMAFPLHAQYMLFSTSHWMPLVNGYSDVIPLDFRQAAAVLDGFPSDAAFMTLAKRRVRYITVHWDMFGPRQDEIRRRLEPYAANLRLLGADSRMTLFEVVRYP
jgi:hypothetical protein